MRRWLVPFVVVVVAAILGSLIVVVAFGDDDSAAATVVLEPVNTTGTDPFTDSVAIDETTDLPSSVTAVSATLATDPQTGGLTARGATPGLYGGTRDETVCDPDQLVTFLDQNPDKAAAWAAVLGIRPANIKNYVAGLTPVVLTTDTRVTNHGYKNGEATTLQSILQAGTAVLVDARGVPRVKCGCGNPLTPPTTNTAAPIGNPWPGYQPDQVTTITPNPRPVTTLTLTDITTGTPYQQDTGTTPNGEDNGGGAIRDADLLNRAYAPDAEGLEDSCLDEPITLVNGEWSDPRNADAGGLGNYGGVTATVTYLDATGDGEQDGVVRLVHGFGGTAYCVVYVVFTIDDGEVGEVARLFTGRTADVPPMLDNGRPGRMVVWLDRPTGTDPNCCASFYARTVYGYQDGGFVKVGETIHPASEVDALREPTSG